MDVTSFEEAEDSLEERAESPWWLRSYGGPLELPYRCSRIHIALPINVRLAVAAVTSVKVYGFGRV